MASDPELRRQHSIAASWLATVAAIAALPWSIMLGAVRLVKLGRRQETQGQVQILSP